MNETEVQMEAIRRAKVLFKERSEAILQWATLACRPLFAPNDSGGEEHVGSCVLLRIHDAHFVLTAAHVLDGIADNEAMYARTPSGMAELVGVRYKNSPKFGVRAGDRVDVGFIELSEDAARSLTDCRFLTTDEIDVNDLAEYQSPHKTQYLALGYPHQLASCDGSATARFLPWTGLPQALHNHKDLKILEESHVMLGFDREQIARSLGVGEFDPVGMSGGGLIRFSSLTPKPTRTDALVGILIEDHTSKRGAVLASRLALVTESIRVALPRLDTHIPKPKAINVNVTSKPRK